MSRSLDLLHESLYDSRKEIHVKPIFKVISNYVRNDKSLQLLYERSAGINFHDISQHFHGRNEQPSNSSFHDSNSASKSLTPLPDWPVALSTWGLSWDFHVYGFSGLYLILTIVSAVIFVRFRLRVQRLKIVHNTLILLAAAGIFRTVFMLVDPYGQKGRMAGLMVGIMTQAVYPLFCASYGLTQVMLLRITNVDVGHSRVRTLSCLLGCTLTYLFLIVVIETLVFYQRELKLLLLLDSGCFVAWSLSLGITFICSGFRLTQYTTETKRARKQLNAFSSYRRSVSNTTGLSALSSTTNDCNIPVFNVDLSSAPPDTSTVSKTISTASDDFSVDFTGSLSSPLSQASGPLLPFSAHRPNAHVRLSRPRLKISNQDHMTVTIATDDDDESTSTTDIEKSRLEEAPRRLRRTRRRRHKRGQQKTRRRSRTPTSSSVYSAISLTNDNCLSNSLFSRSHKAHKSQTTGNEIIYDVVSANTCLLPAPEDSRNKNDEKASKPLVSVTYFKETKQYASSTSHTTSTELSTKAEFRVPQHEKHHGRISDADESLSEYSEEDANRHREISYVRTQCNNSSTYKSEYLQSFVASVEANDDHIFDMNDKGDFGDSFLHANEHLCESPLESTLTFAPVHTELMNSSPKENGYLADTENIISCSALSLFSSSCQRKPESQISISTPRSSSSRSDDSSATSPVLAEALRSNMSASLGLFRIRQSKMVQRAVHLTYLLTFLFMFACLLQLYTIFGVYGVLATIPRPDPWPWLIFHSIFRATEVTIGLTTATIAYIALSHRHQRAKRRHQQLQHLEATRDCIV